MIHSLHLITRHSHRTVGDANNFSFSTGCSSCCPVKAYYCSRISSDIFLLSASWAFRMLMKIKADKSIINLYLQYLFWIFKGVLRSFSFKPLTKNEYLSDYLSMHCVALHFVMPSSFNNESLRELRNQTFCYTQTHVCTCTQSIWQASITSQ